LRQMQIPADTDCRQALLQFMQLLQKWNTAYNLTAVADTDTLLHRHVFDSLSLLPHLAGRRVIDVGSGAGLPGIPLAIACRDREFLLLDANAKKTRFIQQCIIEIGLQNARVHRQRVEAYVPPQGFDTVVSRALAPADTLLAWVDPLLERGRVLLMLGQGGLPELPGGYRLQGVYPAGVPGAGTGRQIAVLEKGS
ncbi:MAG: 16S rRNA (guanine(527)-N(7))-methyltransferase RsmG, partial [Proteobacteria bacterium]|nr:16S rRNA (guanine(527)-N(7))-methyltransferase RsmG [Pseudomonadota bacterium]